ncbi:attractin-like protein 1 [Lates japonicus]|uniref:Attractin-like protein 1 n=1 Tax=Lates japonicus TaxID=270547 RepID=A0AAD3MXE5_LATJO|nr:attractin-like protein 1 [Lates japonicus]
MDPGGKCKTKLFLFGPKLATHSDLRGINRYLVVYVLFYFVLFTHASPAKPCDKNCLSGKCINGSCICDRGWVGDQCQHCQGRFKLMEPSGYLTDGPINYKYKTKCTWLIEGYPNAVLRLRFNHFATECSWDHMYVYDGDSIYAPLVAVFSGLIVPEMRGNETVPEVETTSGYALLHFFSDAAYNLTGFEIFYSINSCPNNCSGHGKCTPGNSVASRVYCECDKYWKGEACDIPYCRNNCGSPDHGYCDLTGEKLCVCNDSWQGPDCSLTVPSTESFWVLPSVKPFGTSLARASHKTVVQEKVMWVVGGYTFNYSSFQMILNYNLESGIWNTVPINSGPVPRYGHSLAAYQDEIYMFGGKLEAGWGNVTDELWVFNVPSRTWQRRNPVVGPPAQAQIYAVEGHSAHCVLLEGGEAIMLVIFGYSPIYSYISNVQEYNLRSNTWLVPETKGAIPQGGYGHSSTYDSSSSSVYVHGGYKALPANKYGLVDDLYRYDVNTRTCVVILSSYYTFIPAQQCTEGWSQVGEACLRINSSRESYDNAQHYCKNLNGNIASLTTSKQVDFVLEELKKLQQQDKRLSPWVGLRKINVSYWGWEDMTPFTNSSLRWLPGEPSDSGFCAYLEEPQVSGLRANPCTATAHGLICEKATGNPNQSTRPSCKKPCSLHTNCANCTSQAMECMWCSSAQRCVDSTAYVISFPYGQCLEWQTGDCVAQNCSGLQTCSQCLEQPECGWCGDPSSTGKGLCMEGSYRGPMKRTAKQGQQGQSQDMSLEPGSCPKDKGYEWAFIHCPACQCNGHSTCVNGSVCEQCRNLTTGPHCQTCMPGYHGDPTNGGKCQACKCNGHASVCQVLTGKCFCTTKGIKGDQCQLCDSENRYLGNPLRGTCYYNLLIDYQFTFSLIQEDDNHYTAINFMASPEQANKNLDMSINASNNFNLNITWSVGSTAGTISGEEVPIVSKTNIKEYRDSFSCEKFTFRSNPNITFYVYVSNFSWPIKIQIAFSQHNSIMDLVQFFVTFFSCFLSLLLVAAVVWKIKQTCWASRRREQLMRERQQMASRPFASVAVALDARGEQTELLQPVLDGVPKPVAMEPCSGGKAAVLTVLMRLPSGPSDLPPPGQSGLIVASALIDVSQQKPTDFKDKSQALKNRKALPPAHQGTCV